MDTLNRVKTVYTADTSVAEAAVKRLRGTERDRAKALLDDLNAENAKLSSSIAMWSKVGVAVGGIVVAYKTLSAASKAYLEDLRLESAAAGINIDRLRASVQGLVETDDLLSFAGRTQNGIWKLNQQEMERVLEGANALRIQMGKELKPTVDALAESITKGSSRALKEFGIEAKDKGELLQILEGRVASLRGETRLAGDDFERSGVAWADAVDNLQGAIGRLAISLAPAVTALAEFTSGLADTINKVQDWDDQLRNAREDMFAWMDEKLGLDTDRRLQRRGPWRFDQQTRLQPSEGGGPAGRDIFGEMGSQLERLRREDAESFTGQFWQAWNQGTFAFRDGIRELFKKRKAGRPGAPGGPLPDNPIETINELAAAISGGISDVGRAIADPSLRGWRPLSEAADKRETGIEGISNGAEAAAAIARANQEIFAQTKGKTMLEAIFGSPADIDLTTTGLQLLGKAFDGVFTAAGAAMDAWITGQKSMGRAFAEGIAEVMRGIAVQSGVEALKHTAYGVGALAFGPILGQTAAQHFAAAALFGGVAIAAGAGARALGAATGQWAGAGAAPAGAALGGGAGRNAAPAATQQQTVIVQLGRDFLGLTDLEQRNLIARAIKQGRQVETTTIRRG